MLSVSCAGHNGAMSARLQAFDSDSEGGEVPADITAAANGQPASKARRVAAQGGPVTQPASAAVQPDAYSSDHDVPAIVESEDESQAADSHAEASDRGPDVEASEAVSSDVSDVAMPAAVAETEPQQLVKSDSEDLSSDEGAEVLEPGLPHVTQTAGGLLTHTADSDSDQEPELKQQSSHAAGDLPVAADGSDSEENTSAAADGDDASGDSNDGAGGADQEQDDAATGRSGVEPDDDVQASAVSAEEQGEDELLSHEGSGPAISAGDPALATCGL